MSQVQMHRKFF